nr:SDR family NAD(P)-dependent oxidoreductase [Brachyspira sp.]
MGKDNENGLKVYKQIKEIVRECLFINATIDNEKYIKSFTDKIVEKFVSIDYLINNACY